MSKNTTSHHHQHNWNIQVFANLQGERQKIIWSSIREFYATKILIAKLAQQNIEASNGWSCPSRLTNKHGVAFAARNTTTFNVTKSVAYLPHRIRFCFTEVCLSQSSLHHCFWEHDAGSVLQSHLIIQHGHHLAVPIITCMTKMFRQ